MVERNLALKSTKNKSVSTGIHQPFLLDYNFFLSVLL